jgi:hypothetical protein
VDLEAKEKLGADGLGPENGFSPVGWLILNGLGPNRLVDFKTNKK